MGATVLMIEVTGNVSYIPLIEILRPMAKPKNTVKE